MGQTVLTKNQNDPSGALQEETVTAVQAHMVYSLRDVTIEGADGVTQTIDTTDSHPFYVQGQGWVRDWYEITSRKSELKRDMKIHLHSLLS